MIVVGLANEANNSGQKQTPEQNKDSRLNVVRDWKVIYLPWTLKAATETVLWEVNKAIDFSWLNLSEAFYREIKEMLSPELYKLINTPYFSENYFANYNADSDLNKIFNWKKYSFGDIEEKELFEAICYWDLLEELDSSLKVEIQLLQSLLESKNNWEPFFYDKQTYLSWKTANNRLYSLISKFEYLYEWKEWLKNKYDEVDSNYTAFDKINTELCKIQEEEKGADFDVKEYYGYEPEED